MAKNLTLAVDEAVLAAVRRYASQQQTSVNAIVRAELERIARQITLQERDWDDLFRENDAAGVEIGPVTWSRDDLHER